MMTRDEVFGALRRDARVIDAHTHVGADAAQYRRGDYPYAQSAEDLLVRLGRWGVDAAVCFPFLYTAWFDLDDFVTGRLRPSGSGLCRAPYSAENENLCREVYEAYPACAGRLLPFAFFDPAREPAAQVAALRELADRYVLFGLKTATSYLRSHVTELLGEGRALLDFAAERNWPVMLHTAVLPGDPWAAMSGILAVVRARPDVRFCLAHTCRFDRAALDQAASLPNCFVDFSAFNIHCQLAMQSHPAVAAEASRFPVDYADPPAALATLAQAYPDTMIWGSDSPYYCFMSRVTDVAGRTHDMRLACGTDTEIAEFRTLPEHVGRGIARDNCLRWLLGPAGAG